MKFPQKIEKIKDNTLYIAGLSMISSGNTAHERAHTLKLLLREYGQSSTILHDRSIQKRIYEIAHKPLAERNIMDDIIKSLLNDCF